jgi:uncharacterized protein
LDLDDAADRDDAPATEGAAETERLPLFPLSGALFPGQALPLHIFEPRYRQLLADRESVDPTFGVVLTRSGREVGDQPDIHAVGTAASLTGQRRYDDGRSDIAVRGGRRFRVVSTEWSGPYLVGEVRWLPEPDGDADGRPVGELAEDATGAMGRLLRLAADRSGVALPELGLPADPRELSYTLSWTLWVNSWERQGLLEVPDTATRLRALVAIIRRESRLLREAGATGVPIERPGQRFLPN